MSLQIQANSNSNQINSISSKNNKIGFVGKPNPEKCPENKHEAKAPTKVKIGVFLATLTGVTLAMADILKKKGFSLTSLASIKQGFMAVEYEEKEIIKLAAGSVGGGLLGGILLDKKEHAKAKIRESVIQFVGNILIPVACVSAASRNFKKIEPIVKKHIPDFGKNVGFMKTVNTVIKATPAFLVSGISLGIGIIGGNKVGNWINEKIFKVDDKRTIKLTDFAPHIDDACMAITLGNPESHIGHNIARIVPAALMVAGVETGTAQERCHKLNPKSGSIK